MNKRKAATLTILIVILAAGGFGIREIQIKQAEIARQEAMEAQEAEQAKREQKIRELNQEAQKIVDELKENTTDEIVCKDMVSAENAARIAQEKIQAYEETHMKEKEDFLRAAREILKLGRERIEQIQIMHVLDEQVSQIYYADDDRSAMNTMKNNQVFSEFQKGLWQIDEEFPQKKAGYKKVVERVSEEWNFVNDDWNYETATLKVSVKEKYEYDTKYWVAHIRTFSPSQLCSALCGDTYGNPRVTTSGEMKTRGGVIGINGSGFSYSDGIPAPGKTMIKDSIVYHDVYSNGNIMCVTQDGGMFTAIAGLTAEDLLNQSVKDTYCFGPTLVEHGQPYTITSAFNQTYPYQRSAIGMVSPGEYYIIVTDGKGAGGSRGFTYEELQKVFLELGCEYAYNLDGGGSSTLVFKGRVLNTLTDGGGERAVADILYFMEAGEGAASDVIVHEGEAMLTPSTES